MKLELEPDGGIHPTYNNIVILAVPKKTSPFISSIWSKTISEESGVIFLFKDTHADRVSTDSNSSLILTASINNKQMYIAIKIGTPFPHPRCSAR